MTTWHNWTGLTSASPTEVRTPRDTDDVVAAVVRARERRTTVKMPGTGHSFTGIAAPEGIMLNPAQLTGIVAVDREAMTVTALAGTPLHVLNTSLEALGLSLHNMGDIAEQTVAGATSTGTHGTGGLVASLSAQLAGLELVTGTGEVIRASATENPDVFAAARVGLGALGILTTLTFHVEPLFTLEAHEFPMTWSDALARFDELAEGNHHFELYWFPHTERVLAKANNRTLDEAEPLGRIRRWVDDEFLSNSVFGLANKLGNRWPDAIARINDLSGRALSERTYSDVPHRVFTSPRNVVFREMEYAVPREAGLDALRTVRRWIDASGLRISFPVEVRTAPADDITLSTASDRDSTYLAFHVNAQTDHTAYFTGVEDILRRYDGRPHWGKLNTRTAEDLAPAYPRWEEFSSLRNRLDPERVFENAYLRRVLGS
jgi:L-gulono-1,4-lactone dehydrogenase